MKKIKILQFPIANSKGGITQYILQNWKYIDKEKFQFDFATMSKRLDFSDALESEGCKIHYISCYAEDNREKFIEEFRKILLEGNYNIVHLHTKQWKSFLVEQIAKEVGVRKIIVHAHNTGVDTLDEQKRKKEIQLHNRVLDQLNMEIATDFWSCSEKAAEFIFKDKIPRSKIIIMKNAIDISKFKYNLKIRNEYREKFGVKDAYVIGNVGRFVYQKNQEFLLEVFSELCKEHTIQSKNCKLLLVGSGEREKEYKSITKEKGLEGKVIFTGERKDVEKLLQAMDLFCFPSRFEGLAISLIEAQTSGLKCICSDTISNEVKITENIKLVPLQTRLWVNEILKMVNLVEKYKRNDMNQIVTKAGYNILSQIKIVEQYYQLI
ncbi:MAG: glycosyltransferase family 1 protein [Hungatella sp.]|nr:glycosyltransferase family 1 protein [Hungatella sp.]